jgi:hypothetical protein
MKKYLTAPPTLVAPEPRENLHLYISATSNVVRTTLVNERGESDTNHKIQYLVNFINEVQRTPKLGILTS